MSVVQLLDFARLLVLVASLQVQVLAGTVTARSSRGMMVDAGSSGSRIHVYSWEQRVYKDFPVPVTVPETNGQFTARISPGIDTFAISSSSRKKTDQIDMNGLSAHLSFLVNYAKNELREHQDAWESYPLYVRATGGVRSLPPQKRSNLMDAIRTLLYNKSFCPFFVQFNSVRVMSGEEEAAYAWLAANYLHGRLLPNMQSSIAIDNAVSFGAVVSPLRNTYGTVDLGGASTQIAYYVPSQDISEGLYKLQIGIYRHWNIYAKSFLRFGYNAARQRHMDSLALDAWKTVEKTPSAVVPRTLDYCFFAGYSEGVDIMTKNGMKNVEVHGPAVPAGDQMERCMDSLRRLLRKDMNSFCDEAYNGECSMDGSYQPPLPQGMDGHFIGTSTYKYPWDFLQMPNVATIDDFEREAAKICSKSFNDIVLYDATLTFIKTPKHSSLLPYYCFLSSYIVVLLQEGYGFTKNNTLSAQDEIKGNKLGWAFGAMLYEVNTLPFKISEVGETRLMGRLLLAWSCGVVVGIVIIGGILSQFLYRPHQRPSHSALSPQNVDEEANDEPASSLYRDLASMYHRGSTTDSKPKLAPRKISQYSPFSNNNSAESTRGGDKKTPFGTYQDSNSSTDTIPLLKPDAKNNSTYQSM